MRAYNFGVMGVTSRNFNGMWLVAGVINWTLILQGDRGVPTNFGRAKNVQNSVRISTTFDSDREYICIGMKQRKSPKALDQLHFIPCWGENWRTLVHWQKKSYRRTCWPTQVEFLRDTKFRPL